MKQEAEIKKIATMPFASAWLGKKDRVMIDVRSLSEFRSVHIDNAHNVPLETLPGAASAVSRLAGSAPVVLLCKSGVRSAKAYGLLLAAGLSNLFVLEGGMETWVRSGQAVEGSQVISIERQVRIGAGALVALGTLLAVLISPWFLIVPGFVGCGLFFAGVTDFCGMGIVLSKMPWNRS